MQLRLSADPVFKLDGPLPAALPGRCALGRAASHGPGLRAVATGEQHTAALRVTESEFYDYTTQLGFVASKQKAGL